MEIRSKLTVNIPDYLANVLCLDEQSKISAAFRDGKVELDIASKNPKLRDYGKVGELNLEQDEWVRSGIIVGRGDREEAYGQGYTAGYEEGYDEGHDEGFEAGFYHGEDEGYMEGYCKGYHDSDAGKPYDDTRPEDEEDGCECACEDCPLRQE